VTAAAEAETVSRPHAAHMWQCLGAILFSRPRSDISLTMPHAHDVSVIPPSLLPSLPQAPSHTHTYTHVPRTAAPPRHTPTHTCVTRVRKASFSRVWYSRPGWKGRHAPHDGRRLGRTAFCRIPRGSSLSSNVSVISPSLPSSLPQVPSLPQAPSHPPHTNTHVPRTVAPPPLPPPHTQTHLCHSSEEGALQQSLVQLARVEGTTRPAGVRKSRCEASARAGTSPALRMKPAGLYNKHCIVPPGLPPLS
jgi:hypothetical protein